MAVMLDVLAGVLSGGRFGGMLGVDPDRGGMAQFFMTTDVTRLCRSTSSRPGWTN